MKTLDLNHKGNRAGFTSAPLGRRDNRNPVQSASDRVLSEAEGSRIVQNVIDRCSGEGYVSVKLMSYWRGELGWARNRASLTSDRRDISLEIVRSLRGGHAIITTNQVDPESIAGAVTAVETYMLSQATKRPDDMKLQKLEWPVHEGPVWSESTFNRTAEQNGLLVTELTQRAEKEGFLSAGYLESHAGSLSILERDKFGRIEEGYERFTQAQCSVTVRHPKGTGSGWAGLSSYVFDSVDERTICNIAFEKCIASLDAVRVEPGRYTTILEPQAVFDFADVLVTSLKRNTAETGAGPYLLGPDPATSRWRSKLGLQILDNRINISHDPADNEIGTVSSPGVAPVTWIENGVLLALYNSKDHSLNELNQDEMFGHRRSFRMTGGPTSLDEMISSTQRGFIVTRFSQLAPLDPNSLLCTGVTRDGLWLVENGKITKPVRNFRITESPLFIFNNVDQLGPAQSIWNPVANPRILMSHSENAIASVVAPYMKVRDFSFTSTVDAI